jgi:hypothetical protein
MPIWGWVLVALFAIGLVITLVEMVQKARVAARVKREGVTVVAHVIATEDKLYLGVDPNLYPGVSPATVVFTLDATLSNVRYAKLEGYAKALREYTAANASAPERALADLKNASAKCLTPVRLPDRLTGGEEVYAASVEVNWKDLTNGRLAHPYIHCKAVVGPGGGVLMIASPPTDWVPAANVVARAGAATAAPGAEAEPSGVPAQARAVYSATARALFAEKVTRKEAKAKLREAGCPETELQGIIDEAWQANRAAQRAQGAIELGLGLVMLAVGIGITVASTSADGGGVVMTGLIAVGSLVAFRGMLRAAVGF